MIAMWLNFCLGAFVGLLDNSVYEIQEWFDVNEQTIGIQLSVAFVGSLVGLAVTWIEWSVKRFIAISSLLTSALCLVLYFANHSYVWFLVYSCVIVMVYVFVSIMSESVYQIIIRFDRSASLFNMVGMFYVLGCALMPIIYRYSAQSNWRLCYLVISCLFFSSFVLSWGIRLDPLHVEGEGRKYEPIHNRTNLYAVIFIILFLMMIETAITTWISSIFLDMGSNHGYFATSVYYVGAFFGRYVGQHTTRGKSRDYVLRLNLVLSCICTGLLVVTQFTKDEPTPLLIIISLIGLFEGCMYPFISFYMISFYPHCNEKTLYTIQLVSAYLTGSASIFAEGYVSAAFGLYRGILGFSTVGIFMTIGPLLFLLGRKDESQPSIIEVVQQNKMDILRDLWNNVLGHDVGSSDVSFFEVGGHSLSAARLSHNIRTRFRREVSVKDIFVHHRLGDMLTFIQRAPESVQMHEQTGLLGVSRAQRRILLDNMIRGEDSFLYSECMSVTIHGEFDLNRLVEAIRYVIQNNAILRVRYHMNDKGEWDQVFSDDLPTIDVCNNIDLKKHIRHMRRGFSINESQLRVSIVDGQYMIYVMSHTICDHATAGLFARLVSEAYCGHKRKTDATYMDFLHYDNVTQTNDSTDYWLWLLSPFKNCVLNLPSLTVNKANSPIERVFVPIVIEADMYRDILDYQSRNLPISMFSLLICVYYVALSKWANQSKLTIGVAVDSRDVNPKFDYVLGMFQNMIACPFDVDHTTTSFDSLVKMFHAFSIDSMAHFNCSFDEIVRMLGARSANRSPIFQTMFTLWTVEPEREYVEIPGCVCSYGIPGYESDLVDSLKFDVELYMEHDRAKSSMIGEFALRSDMFTTKDAVLFVNRFFLPIMRSLISGHACSIAESVSCDYFELLESAKQYVSTIPPNDGPKTYLSGDMTTLPSGDKDMFIQLLSKWNNSDFVHVGLVRNGCVTPAYVKGNLSSAQYPDVDYEFVCGQMGKHIDLYDYISLDGTLPSVPYRSCLGPDKLTHCISTSFSDRWIQQNVHAPSATEMRILKSINDTRVPFEYTSIFDMFHRRVKMHPSKPAVVHGNDSIDYLQLFERASVLSKRLHGDIVPVCISRSIDMIVGMFAVIMSGATYCPILRTDPEDRWKFITEHVGAKCVLTDLAQIPVDLPIVSPTCCERFDGYVSPKSSNDVAYLVFTSGTTGRPKSVQITHSNFSNLILALTSTDHLLESDRCLQLARTSFDIHCQECFAVPCIGGTIIMISDGDEIDYDAISRAIQQQNVTYSYFVPSHATMMASYLDNEHQWQRLSGMRTIDFIGEAFPLALAKKFKSNLPNTNIQNTYGPAEITVLATVKRCEMDDQLMHLGTFLPNYFGLVMDRNHEPCMIGSPGELWIGGNGVMMGYKGQTSPISVMTAPECGITSETKFYQTGDMVMIDHDGRMIFLGRKDKSQIKLHGQRLELEEINSVIRELSSVLGVHTMVRSDVLVSYVLPVQDTKHILDHCRSRLPKYMVPTHVVSMDDFPKNNNMKLDTKMLPEPVPTTLANEVFEETTPTRKLLAHLVRKIIGVSTISRAFKFFENGGSSLNAAQMAYGIQNGTGKAITIHDIFKYELLSDLADHIEHLPSVSITKSHENETIASMEQRRFFMDELVHSQHGIPMYNIVFTHNVSDTYSREDIIKAIVKVIEHQETLRTLLRMNDGNITQIVVDPPTDFMIRDFESVEDATRYLSYHKFDLSRDIPIAVGIVNRTLCVCIHHVAVDATSMGIFNQNLQDALTNTLVKPPFRYIDFSITERRMLHDSERFSSSVKFWSNVIQSDAPPIRTDMKRDSQHGKSMYIIKRFSSDVIQRIDARRASIQTEFGCTVTRNSFFLSLLQILMHKWLNSDTVNVSTMSSNRLRGEWKDIVGCFVNPILFGSKSCKMLSEHVANTSRHVTSSFEHQWLPFIELCQSLRIDPAQITTIFFQMGVEEWTYDMNTQIDEIPLIDNIAATDLSLEVNVEHDGCLKCVFMYDERSFHKHTIQALTERWERMVLVAHSAETIHDLDWYTFKPDMPLCDFGTARTIANMIQPSDHCAACMDGAYMSYLELIEKSRRLASRMKDVRCGDIVTVCAKRGFDMIVAMVAVQLKGAIYCALSIRDPEARHEAVISLLGARLVLCDTDRVFSVPSLRIDDVDGTFILSPQEASDVAYIVLTSGSTGVPKAVQITHENFFNYIMASDRAGIMKRGDRVVQMARSSFDVHCQEIYGTLCLGGTVVLLREDSELDFDYISTTILNHEATYMFTTTSYASTYTAHLTSSSTWNMLRSLQTWDLGGEMVTYEVTNTIRKYIPNVFNTYGPAEATVTSMFHQIQTTEGKGPVPLGQPMYNYSCMIIDRNNMPIIPGTCGELCIGGKSVMKGYMNIESKCFVHLNNERYYRTGDIVHFSSDGIYTFVGRADTQVKLRGQRFELGEVDSTIRSIPGVNDCVSIIRNKALISYIVSDDDLCEKVTEHCRDHLPSYMVPSFVVKIDALPFSSNMKLDTKALPDPSYCSKPTFKSSNHVSSLVSNILSIEESKLGPDDDFFQIGGNSLLAARMVANLKNVKISDVFALRTLGAILTLSETNRIEKPIIPSKSTVSRMSTSQSWFAKSHHRNSYATFTINFSDRAEFVARMTNLIEHQWGLRSLHVNGMQIVQETTCFQFSDKVDLTPFDLERELPIRVVLKEQAAHVMLHHIAYDALALSIFEHELEGSTNDYQASDFALYESERPGGTDAERFWKSTIELDEPGLPFDRPTERGNMCHMSFVYGDLKNMKQIARELSADTPVTMYSMALALLQKTMFKWCKKTNISSWYSNRERPEWNRIIAPTVNRIVYGTKHANKDIKELIVHTSQVVYSSLPHQWYPFEKLELDPDQYASIKLQYNLSDAFTSSMYNIENFHEHNPTDDCDIYIKFDEHDTTWLIHCYYDSNRFNITSIDTLCSNLKYFIDQIK